MRIDAEFVENSQTFDADFGQIYTITDGGFERGYEQGYNEGEIDGYNKGHTDGQEVGYNTGYIDGIESVPDYLEKVLTNTLTEYASETLTTVKAYTFRGCTKLVSVYLPKVATIYAQAFHTCTGLTTLDFPSLTTLEAYAFTDCANLTSVNFPKLTYLQASCLQNCSRLEVADFPNVNQMGNLVFSGCTKLVKLILRRNAVCSMSNTQALANTPIANGTGFVYVPDNLVEQYKVARNWTTYANAIKPLSELEA